jgi:hypothetical protein
MTILTLIGAAACGRTVRSSAVVDRNRVGDRPPGSVRPWADRRREAAPRSSMTWSTIGAAA